MIYDRNYFSFRILYLIFDKSTALKAAKLGGSDR